MSDTATVEALVTVPVKQTLRQLVQEIMTKHPGLPGKDVYVKVKEINADAKVESVLAYVSNIKQENKPVVKSQPTLGEIRTVRKFIKENPNLLELLEQLAPVLAIGPVEKIQEIYDFLNEE